MALEGTLRDFSLADIFQLIGLQRKTGVLTLRSKEDTVTVTFLDGKVVGADSLDRRLENRLGSVLIRTGYLTQDQLNRALEIQRETLQRLGFILTHYGIISAESLKEAIQLQITQIVYRLFRWHDGDYHFSQETTIEYDRDNVTPISAESILMEGARMIDEWPIIEKRIRSYDMVFRKKLTDQEIVVVGAEDADEIDFDGTASRKRKGGFTESIRITQEEKMIYSMVDGTMTVGEIVEVSRLPEFDTNKALYELLTRDLIEEVRGASAAAVLQQATPVDESEVAETPVPLPLVLILVVLAIGSLVTSVRNPLNSIRPLTGGVSSVTATRKADLAAAHRNHRPGAREIQRRAGPPADRALRARPALHRCLAAPRSVGQPVQIPATRESLSRDRVLRRWTAGHGSLPGTRCGWAFRSGRHEDGDGRDHFGRIAWSAVAAATAFVCSCRA
jgi:hypothetical protein